MGFQINTSSARSARSTQTTLAEINVTPLVDVMLVLLIIFMVSAPMMQQGIQVDLPKANAGTLSEIPDQLTLVITKDQSILMNGKLIAISSLRTRLSGIVSAKPDVEVLIQGDHAASYGFVAQVMAEVKQARIHRVGLVTAPPEK